MNKCVTECLINIPCNSTSFAEKFVFPCAPMETVSNDQKYVHLSLENVYVSCSFV